MAELHGQGSSAPSVLKSQDASNAKHDRKTVKFAQRESVVVMPASPSKAKPEGYTPARASEYWDPSMDSDEEGPSEPWERRRPKPRAPEGDRCTERCNESCILL
mmetsp:Transcript_39132/g.71256  ORF Transcript_39132/g.71256 Transcript_39132/m.71256 type:complete len:104 (+) Transcript_39132:2-313(+)